MQRQLAADLGSTGCHSPGLHGKSSLEHVFFFNSDKHETSRQPDPFLVVGSCLKMHLELWTKALVSQLFTDRTAASCPTKTCSNCSLTSESRLFFFLTVSRLP